MAETKPGSKILRVLILDESPDDAEQASAACGRPATCSRPALETGVAVEQNLDSNQWT